MPGSYPGACRESSTGKQKSRATPVKTSRAHPALTDKSVQAILDKRPLVTFPAAIAVARIQAVDYNSYTLPAYRPLNPAAAYGIDHDPRCRN